MENLKDTLIVTATLGGRLSLTDTVESVAKYGGARVEHIIITPKSTFQNLRDQFPNHQVLCEPEGCRGIYQALNYVFKNYGREYKYLGFINDDDLWTSGYPVLFDILDKNLGIDVAYGRVQFVDEMGVPIGEQTSFPFYKFFPTLLTKNIILFTQQATLMRSKIYFAENGFDEAYKLIADTKFWLSAITNRAKLKATRKICAKYMIQSGQLSSNKELQRKEHKELIKMIARPNSVKTISAVLLFRLYNLRIYIERIFAGRSVHRA